MELTSEMLLEMVAAAPDSLLAVDHDGHIVFANDQTEHVFGWHPDELVGRLVEDLVPADVARLHVDHRAGYLRDPQPRPMGAGLQLTARRKDGTLCPVDISLNAVSGRDDGLVLVAVRDVTERIELENERRRRELESQRQQSHRLESLGELAGGVAHDFNNLLGVILNYVTLLEHQVTSPQLVDDLGQIRTAAQRGSALTRQLLAFARQDVADAEAVDVGAVLRDVVTMLRRTLPADIQVDLELTDEPLVAESAPHSLEQVLLNLAINARDAMPDGGRLRVCATGGADHVEIRVIDDGVGMTPDVRGRALEPFFTTKQRGQGTGLGLSTVYGIVRAHGGDVTLESTAGAGTTVTVRLPAAEVVTHPVEASGETGAAGHESILLVDNEPALRESTRRILAEQGYHVLLAADGVEALETVERAAPIDLVITDVVMPGLRGDQLAVALRERHAALPVIVMTGSDPSASPDHARILRKPFTHVELLAAVRDELDG